MEKPTASPRKPKISSLCIPRLRGNAACANKNNKSVSPMTLLERFREAVLRLIMLSALSKATSNGTGSTADAQTRRCCYPNDSHHSEAVADCIEFIKKTASADEENRESSASSSFESEMAMAGIPD
ncbi:hypothetical protein I3843_08G126000 [Carya illinoinensis]|uniref:Josephin-like protein n=2 Tax=Carya illinoinensis TaxID=32201 RepID=A0A922JDW1_CARIL|nr:hypothetical protein I3842_08G132800 [Carya illinoinensis]KAG7967938.1 hypothetical protein I3843_08G126000 [Carya illinoinensis]